MSTGVLRNLKSLSENADKVQNDLLLSLIKKNAGTEYGKKYDFAHINSIQEYQNRVPLTDWEHYEDYIGRMLKGEENILSADSTAFYCISAGSTDQPKYVPLTANDIEIQRKYWIDGVEECINDYLSKRPGTTDRRKIFYIGEFFRTFMENGTMSGVRAGAPYRFMETEDTIDYDLFTAPKEVLFPDKLEDMLYMKLRFALAERSVTAIHGIFVHKIVGLFDYLCKNWDAFIKDIGTGSVSDQFGISEEWKSYLSENLPPDPARANELKNIFPGDGGNLAIKIWPDLKYVCVAGGSLFARYMKSLKKYFGITPIHYFVYATSESNIGISLQINDEDAYYTMLPDAAFYEFLPVDSDAARPLTAWEVEKGKEYELIATTLSGLYRYSVQDVVKVVDFYGSMPVISISYRKNQLLNLADEKINTRQLEQATDLLASRMGTGISDYCVDAGNNENGAKPGYIIYIETEMGRSNNDKKCSEIVDKALRDSSAGYRLARENDRLREAQVISLKKGAFRSYGAYLSNHGYRMEQNKPLRIITSDEQRDFFTHKAWE